MPKDFEPLQVQELRSILYLVVLFVLEYQKEVVELVKNHVLKGYKEFQDAPSSLSRTEHWAARRCALMDWSKKKFPLSYNEGYELLTTALSETPEAIGKGLPQNHQKSISIEEFGQLIFTMGRPHNPAGLSPPIFRSSSLSDSLRVTVQMFICSIGNNQHKTTSDAFAGYVRFACNVLKINFGPWSLGGFPRIAGMRKEDVDRVVVPNVWITFGKPPPPGLEVPAALMTNADAVGRRLRIVKHRTINSDCRAEWTASDIGLGDLSIFFKRTVNPQDFSVDVAGVDTKTHELIRETYEWANKLFDIKNPVHHLVLFTAILFSKAQPHIGWPSDAKIGAPIFDRQKNVDAQTLQLARYICRLPWCDGRTSKNKLSDGDAFIPIFITYFLAYAGDDQTGSPLLQAMDGIERIPPAWGSKHSELSNY